MTLEEREAKAAAAKRKSFVQTMANEDKQEQNTPPPKSSKVETEDGEKFKQRSYYLTDELLKAITIKTAETNLDKSGVVREALEMYLADILEKFRK